jgi:hypothetical protein
LFFSIGCQGHAKDQQKEFYDELEPDTLIETNSTIKLNDNDGAIVMMLAGCAIAHAINVNKAKLIIRAKKFERSKKKKVSNI